MIKLWKTNGVNIIAEYINAEPDQMTIPCSHVEEYDKIISSKTSTDGDIHRSIISNGVLLVKGVKSSHLPDRFEGNMVHFMDEETGREIKVPILTPEFIEPDTVRLRIR